MHDDEKSRIEPIRWETVEDSASGSFLGGFAGVDVHSVHVEFEGMAVVIDNRLDTVEGGKRLAQQLLSWMRVMQREAEAFYEREGAGP